MLRPAAQTIAPLILAISIATIASCGLSKEQTAAHEKLRALLNDLAISPEDRQLILEKHRSVIKNQLGAAGFAQRMDSILSGLIASPRLGLASLTLAPLDLPAAQNHRLRQLERKLVYAVSVGDKMFNRVDYVLAPLMAGDKFKTPDSVSKPDAIEYADRLEAEIGNNVAYPDEWNVKDLFFEALNYAERVGAS